MVLLALESPAIEPVAAAEGRFEVGAALLEASSSAELRRVTQSRQRVAAAMRRVLDLDHGFLTFMNSDLESRATGICAEEVADTLFEDVAQRANHLAGIGLVDVLRGDGQQIEMGEVQLQLDGANVIMRRGRKASEVDGALLIGDGPQHIALYDVTTSAEYLAAKLTAGESFFQGVRKYFDRRFGIRLEKWHILLDEKLRGELDPSICPLNVPHLPASASPDAGVHVLSLPLKRQVRILRERTLAVLQERRFVECDHGRYRFN